MAVLFNALSVSEKLEVSFIVVHYDYSIVGCAVVRYKDADACPEHLERLVFSPCLTDSPLSSHSLLVILIS